MKLALTRSPRYAAQRFDGARNLSIILALFALRGFPIVELALLGALLLLSVSVTVAPASVTLLLEARQNVRSLQSVIPGICLRLDDPSEPRGCVGVELGEYDAYFGKDSPVIFTKSSLPTTNISWKSTSIVPFSTDVQESAFLRSAWVSTLVNFCTSFASCFSQL